MTEAERGGAALAACERTGRELTVEEARALLTKQEGGRVCYTTIMAKGDEPRQKQQHWSPAGTSAPAATTFAGNIMAIVAVMLLFDDEDHTESEDQDSTRGRQ